MAGWCKRCASGLNGVIGSSQDCSMPNVTGAIRPWRSDRWSLRVSLAIEGWHQRRRNRIAKLLEIDPSEHEWRSRPVPLPSVRNLPRNKAYIEWRKAPSAGGANIPRIDLAIEQIAGEICRCWAIHRNVMRAGTLPLSYTYTILMTFASNHLGQGRFFSERHA